MIKILLSFISLCVVIACFHMRNPGYSGCFHSDEKHTGLFSERGYKNLGPVKWKFQTDGKIFSSPLAAGEMVYVGSEDSSLYAIRAKTGELNWKFHTGGAVSSSPAIFNQIVYFTSYDGFCYAVDAGSGKEIWKFRTGGEKKVGAKGLWTMKPADLYMEDLFDFFLSSPVVDINDEPTVYFGSSDGNLYALDALKGGLKWKFKTDGIIHTSPALYQGTVFFGSWDRYLYAVDSKTGKEKWKFRTRDQPVYHLLEGIQASPTVSDSLVYFGARDGFFYALNVNTGVMAWNYSADNSWVLTTAAIRDSMVYFGTSDSYLMTALNARTGEKKWTMKVAGYLYSSPAIAGETAYFGDFTGNIYALDLNSAGKKYQTFSTDSRKANAARILNQKGELDFSFTAGVQDLSIYESSVDVMNEFYHLAPIVSSPSVSGNTVYFGSADGYLYALELRN
jgi:eukaryotic-like serine/threonine-protein kinase